MAVVLLEMELDGLSKRGSTEGMERRQMETVWEARPAAGGEEHREVSVPPGVLVYKSWMEVMALGLHSWDSVSHRGVFSASPHSWVHLPRPK